MGSIFEIQYPPIYRDLIARFGVLELGFLNINAMPLACLANITFIHSMVLRTAGPAVLFFMLFLLMLFCQRKADEYGADGKLTKAGKYLKYKNLAGSTIFVTLFLIYPSTSSTIFQTFMCESFDDGTRWLKVDYSIDCNSTGYQLAVVPYAVLMIFVYPIGTVALYTYLFYTHRHVLQKLRRDEMRAAGRKTDRLIRRNSWDLGERLVEHKLSVTTTMRSLLTEEVFYRQPRDVLLVLHPNCIAAYEHESTVPVPIFWCWLDQQAKCTMHGEPGALLLEVEGKSRVDSAQTNIMLTIRPPLVPSEDDRGNLLRIDPTVLMTKWDSAVGVVVKQMQAEKRLLKKRDSHFLAKEKHTLHKVLMKTKDASDDLADDRVQSAADTALPGYFKKLIGPYELRVFWFEIFECVRKILLIGLPIFLEAGSMPQLVLGLLICFFSFGAYMQLAPYRLYKHDIVAQICQMQIFFALLAGVILNNSPEEANVRLLGLILVGLQAVPPFFTLFLSSPWSKHVLEPQRRRKHVRMLVAVLTIIKPSVQLRWAKLCHAGKFRKESTVSKDHIRTPQSWTSSSSCRIKHPLDPPPMSAGGQLKELPANTAFSMPNWRQVASGSAKYFGSKRVRPTASRKMAVVHDPEEQGAPPQRVEFAQTSTSPEVKHPPLYLEDVGDANELPVPSRRFRPGRRYRA